MLPFYHHLSSRPRAACSQLFVQHIIHSRPRLQGPALCIFSVEHFGGLSRRIQPLDRRTGVTGPVRICTPHPPPPHQRQMTTAASSGRQTDYHTPRLACRSLFFLTDRPLDLQGRRLRLPAPKAAQTDLPNLLLSMVAELDPVWVMLAAGPTMGRLYISETRTDVRWTSACLLSSTDVSPRC